MSAPTEKRRYYASAALQNHKEDIDHVTGVVRAFGEADAKGTFFEVCREEYPQKSVASILTLPEEDTGGSHALADAVERALAQIKRGDPDKAHRTLRGALRP